MSNFMRRTGKTRWMMVSIFIFTILTLGIASAAPNPPGDVTVSVPSNGTVTLQWSDNSDDETAFYIYYNDGQTHLRATADATSLTESGLECGTTQFVVYAYGNGWSSPSNEVTADPCTTTDSLLSPNPDGEYHLIVNLQMSNGYSPESEISGGDASVQRDAIAAQQDAMIDTLPDGVTVDRAFTTVPAMAVTAENERALQQLQESGLVVSVRENAIYELQLAETTDVINVDNVWNAGFTGSGISVAILDTGVDTSHPFLAGRVVHEACFSSAMFPNATSLCPNGSHEQIGSGAASPATCAGVGGCSHGTHVAGIAAGNGTAFDGVAFNANIIAIQVFSRVNDFQMCNGNPPCLLTSDSDYIAALEHIHVNLSSQYNIASANMSLGNGYAFTTDCDNDIPNVANIISTLRNQHDIATVIASGNVGYINGVGMPACVSSAITVGATTDNDTIIYNRGNLIELLAPGWNVRSSVIGGQYDDYNGTSMAAPHVAGAWAVVRSMPQFANASVTDVLNHLEDMAVTVREGSFNYPRLNFTQPSSNNPTITPTPTSSPTPQSPSGCGTNKVCLFDGNQLLELDGGSGWIYLSDLGWEDRIDGLINNTTFTVNLYDYDGQGYYNGSLTPGINLSTLGSYNDAADAVYTGVGSSNNNPTVTPTPTPSPTPTPPSSGCNADKVCLFDGGQVLVLDAGSGWVYLSDLGWENRVDGLINNTTSTPSLYDYDGQGYHSNPSTLTPGTNLSTLGSYNDAADAVYIP